MKNSTVLKLFPLFATIVVCLAATVMVVSSDDSDATVTTKELSRSELKVYWDELSGMPKSLDEYINDIGEDVIRGNKTTYRAGDRFDDKFVGYVMKSGVEDTIAFLKSEFGFTSARYTDAGFSVGSSEFCSLHVTGYPDASAGNINLSSCMTSMTRGVSLVACIIEPISTVKVTSIGVQGYSNNIITMGYNSTGSNSERSYLVNIIKPTNADLQFVTAKVVSGDNVISIRTGTNAMKTFTYLYITPKSTGTATILLTANDGGGAQTTLTVNVNKTYNATLTYNANGGSGAPPSESDSSSTGKHFWWISDTIPTRSGYTFLGWSEDRNATVPTYNATDPDLEDRVESPSGVNVTLYAVWQQASLDITTSQSNKTISTGTAFSYTVGTNVSGCTITVSGASWLSVSGNTVYGTPTTPGTYDITVTASKSGYSSDTQTFRITVVSALDFTSKPTTGLIIIEQ